MLNRVWTDVDACGHRLEIYGSGGWGSESLRACCAKPLLRRGFAASTVERVGGGYALGAILGSHFPSE